MDDTTKDSDQTAEEASKDTESLDQTAEEALKDTESSDTKEPEKSKDSEKTTVDPKAAEAALAAFEASEDQSDSKKAPLQLEGGAGRPKEDEKTESQGPEEQPPVVRFTNVTKTYATGTQKEFTAIKDVTFVVEDLPQKGEFICILGPSGCGKSTILKLVAGLEPQHPPTSGTVEVFGQQVTGPGADRGMVFQSYTSFDNRTVLRNVAFGLECRGVSKKEREEQARDWINKVELSVEHDAGKYPHQLSGGMQQRVAIARTLILHPKIILMDEPFGALDPVTRMQMQDLLVNLWRSQEATVFFVTHSIREAVYLGDRAYLLSSSPGTLLREVDVPPPDRPAMEMQRDPAFQETVYELSEVIHRMEAEQQQRAD